MSEQTKKLLDLLQVGKSCNEICEILHLSNKQLYNNLTNLRNKGIMFLRKYYETGDIIYQLAQAYESTDGYVSKQILMNKEIKNLKVLVVSDLHFGNRKEGVEAINHAFEYCLKNNIHIIFCCGDLIDGSFTRGEQRIPNIYAQIDHFIKNYPHDKNILTFGVGGDHDLSTIENYGQDLLEAISNYRHDVVIPSYNNVIICLKGSKILLHHHIQKGSRAEGCDINFFGHTHKYMVSYTRGSQFDIKVPSLSNIYFDTYPTIPSMLECEFVFDNNEISMIHLKQIQQKEVNYILSEMTYELTKNRKKKTKDSDGQSLQGGTTSGRESAKPKVRNLSQTDRFYRRYFRT